MDSLELRTTLRQLAQPQTPFSLDNTRPCTNEMTCECAGCQVTRHELVKRGVRYSAPMPIKHRKAA